MRTVRFNTQPKMPLPTSKLKKRKPFYGTVSEDHFEIVPWIYYFNSFLPIIYGQVMQKEKGFSIDITMRLDTMAKTFMIFWFSLCTLFLLVDMSTLNGAVFQFRHIFPLIMFAFGFGLMHFGFWIEAKKCKKRLLELFKYF